MLTLEEALSRLMSAVQPLPATDREQVSTFDALGRVLAEDVRSGLDVPPADNTSMDGYALRCADVPVAGVVLPVSQRIPAGVVGVPLQPGSAARIFTGAQVPAGADAVVMQEQCEPVGDGVRVSAMPQPANGSVDVVKTCGRALRCWLPAPGSPRRRWAWRHRWARRRYASHLGPRWPCSPPATNW